MDGRAYGRVCAPGAISAAVFTCLLVFSFSAAGAVDGISNSKLVTPSADPVPPGLFEFEPAFATSRARSRFNEFGHRKNIPGDFDQLSPDDRRSSESQSGMGFRLTAGAAPGLEIGFGYEQNISETSPGGDPSSAFSGPGLGLKFLLNDENAALRFALEAGANLRSSDWTGFYEGGLILTWDITKHLSLDLDGTVGTSQSRLVDEQKTIERVYGANLAIGYTFTQLQLVAELNYSRSRSKFHRSLSLPPALARQTGLNSDILNREPLFAARGNTFLPLPSSSFRLKDLQEAFVLDERKLSLSLGFTYAVNDHAAAIITLGGDLVGVNSSAERYFSGAFTFVFGAESDSNAQTGRDSERAVDS